MSKVARFRGGSIDLQVVLPRDEICLFHGMSSDRVGEI